jgi:hypothetical protein
VVADEIVKGALVATYNGDVGYKETSHARTNLWRLALVSKPLRYRVMEALTAVLF